MLKLLVIDDEPLIGEMISLMFPEDKVTICLDAERGILTCLSWVPDVVLCDIGLPEQSGLEVFERLQRIDAKVPVIMMTGQGSAGTAIAAMQRGAFEYVLKPFNPKTLVPLVESAAEAVRLTRTPVLTSDLSLAQEFANQNEVLVGRCPAMQEVYRSIGRVARHNVTTLILGESGTGKEVVARAIYQYSHRAEGRFLAINCSAIPEQLLESELFGHEKGAFTGADRTKPGKFELCNDGTLFLDEIGDMSPLMQTKILRVLQDQMFERVGGSETIRTNARVIAATNRNLEQAIADNKFRSDLFYRLNVYTINLPALRERGDDIQLLSHQFLHRFSTELGKKTFGFSKEALELIVSYSWPGNVRELQSAVKHALLQASGPVIVPANFPQAIRHQVKALSRPSIPTKPNFCFTAMTRERLESGSDDIHQELVGMAEREIIAEVMGQLKGNLVQASKRLGIARTTLRTKLTALGLNPSNRCDPA